MILRYFIVLYDLVSFYDMQFDTICNNSNLSRVLLLANSLDAKEVLRKRVSNGKKVAVLFLSLQDFEIWETDSSLHFKMVKI